MYYNGVKVELNGSIVMIRPHSSMDRTQASEACNAGSIPAGSTAKNKPDTALSGLKGH